jgi:hypothetical protein
MRGLFRTSGFALCVALLGGCSGSDGSGAESGVDPMASDSGTVGSTGNAGAAGKGKGGALGTGGSRAGAPAAGGSSGTGGSSGSGGPHTVGKCDGLGPVGKWEKITPQALTKGPAAFAVDPLNAGTVYLGTGDSCWDQHCDGVFKTTDCGSTWVKINTGRNGADLDKGDQWGFAIDPVDSQVLYATSGYGTNGLYKSTNGGVDWDIITPQGDGAPGWVGSQIQLDPENHDHLLIRWHAPCGKYEDQIGCFAESTDAGATWKEHYGTPSWQPEVTPYLLHGSTWIANFDGIELTTDAGVTWKKVSTDGAGGHSAGSLYRGQGGSYFVGVSGGVLRSAAGADGASWSVVPNSSAWVQGVTGNGTTIFAGTRSGFFSAPESDGLKWTAMPGSPTHSDGCFAGYDVDHHILYASCMLDGGFSRVVTE